MPWNIPFLGDWSILAHSSESLRITKQNTHKFRHEQNKNIQCLDSVIHGNYVARQYQAHPRATYPCSPQYRSGTDPVQIRHSAGIGPARTTTRTTTQAPRSFGFFHGMPYTYCFVRGWRTPSARQATLAQSVERLTRNEQVVSSILTSGSTALGWFVRLGFCIWSCGLTVSDRLQPSGMQQCASGGIGRRAGFRFLCLRRVGSSPISRTEQGFPDSPLLVVVFFLISQQTYVQSRSAYVC